MSKISSLTLQTDAMKVNGDDNEEGAMQTVTNHHSKHASNVADQRIMNAKSNVIDKGAALLNIDSEVIITVND